METCLSCLCCMVAVETGLSCLCCMVAVETGLSCMPVLYFRYQFAVHYGVYIWAHKRQ